MTKTVIIQFDVRKRKAKLDCSISQLAVRSFVDFLNSVEPTPGAGADIEGLEVAKDCLINLFKLAASSIGNQENPLIVEMFKSQKTDDNVDDDGNDDDDSDPEPEPLALLAEDEWTSKLSTLGVSKDELVGRYFAALAKMKCVNTTTDEKDDPIKKARVTRLFQDAFMEMERWFDCHAHAHAYSLKDFADSLKEQGNKVMQSKQYDDAMKLYTCALSLCGSNAVYYCNRAAALMHISEYNQAIKDCEKAIKIDPSYSNAYGRLGSAYFALGKYKDSIDKGFKKALQLDRRNEILKKNIQMAEYKLATSSSQNSMDSDASKKFKPDLMLDTGDICIENIVNLRSLLLAGGSVDSTWRVALPRS